MAFWASPNGVKPALALSMSLSRAAAGRARSVVLPPRQIKNLTSCARQRRRRGSKLGLVLVIDRYVRAQNQHSLSLRHPVEIRVHQQFVIFGQCRQIVAVSIAVPLREHDFRVRRVDHAVAILVGYVVIQRIDDLARGDSVGVVPVEAVIDRGQIDARAPRCRRVRATGPDSAPAKLAPRLQRQRTTSRPLRRSYRRSQTRWLD